MPWVYMIKNKGGDIYVGVSKHPAERLLDHNKKRGAHFAKTNSSFALVFLEGYQNFKEARKREIQIKKWRRDKKELLIAKYSQGLDTRFSCS